MKDEKKEYLTRAVETTIRVGVLVLLIGWCFWILTPFIPPVIWGIVIAVAVYPIYRRLRDRMGGKGKLAATIIALFFIAILILPALKLADSLIAGVRGLNQMVKSEDLVIAPPPPEVADWPVIGRSVFNTWDLASQNLADVVEKFEPQIISFSGWLVSSALNTGLAILLFAFSIIISGIMLANSQAGGKLIKDLFVKLAGDQGEDFAQVSEVTVRQVTKGILGVAVIQSMMAGLGFVVAGVPGAGLWTLICLFLAIIQIGISPVTIPVIIYMFYNAHITTAVILMIWLIIATMSDNILKPILLGAGAPVPMVVIFLGAIGGFIAFGFIGLFIGAIVLSLGYKLFLVWLRGDYDGDKKEEALNIEH